MSHFLLILTLLVGGLPVVAEAKQPQARGKYRERARQTVVVPQQAAPLSTYLHVEPHHASTVIESWLRGRAALIQSLGVFSYLQGLGAIAREEAREHAIENHCTAVVNWFKLKALNHAIRFPARPKASTSQLVNAQRKAIPARLSPSDLSADGRIYWPDLLLAKEFDERRTALDKLFRKRAGSVRPGGKTALRQAIGEETEKLHAELSARIDEYPTSDYLAARKFIVSLRREAQFDNRVVLSSR